MRLLIALIAVMVALTGCKAEEEVVAPAIVSTPLEFDPTEEYDLSRWWSNGQEMIRLEETRGYVVYATTNRYGRVAQRGRWRQQNYATLWLQPYTTHEPTEIRVNLTKENGELRLHLPRLAPMRAIDAPPRVIEDRLLGEWADAGGTLRLASDLRYTFTQRPNGAARPVGHQGTWLVEDDTLHLRPGSSSIPAMEFGIEEAADGAIALQSASGRLRRNEPR